MRKVGAAAVPLDVLLLPQMGGGIGAAGHTQRSVRGMEVWGKRTAPQALTAVLLSWWLMTRSPLFMHSQLELLSPEPLRLVLHDM